MTFTIHASKDGNLSQTMRIDAATAVRRAEVLLLSGFQVHITDSQGSRYQPEDFHRLSAFGDSMLPLGTEPLHGISSK